MNWSYESTPTEHTWHTPESSTTTSGGPSTREIEDLARQTGNRPITMSDPNYRIIDTPEEISPSG